MKSFCQFILLILLTVTSSCSWFSTSKPDDALLLSRVEPAWFTGNEIRLANYQGEVQPHLFYDPASDLNPALSHIDFLPLSVAGSDVAYDLDVISGQRFFAHFNCGQADVWRERRSLPSRPSYTLGVIPRHFDQLNQPQRIIVFGGMNRFKINEPVTYRARIVGAVVEQICPQGKCAGPNDWVGRLVLVGIDETDRKFGKVRTLADLKQLISWEDVQGELENHEGRNYSADQEFPAVRVGNLLESKDALDFMLKRSVVMTTKELISLQKNCAVLYQKLWNDVGAENFLDKPAKSKEEIKKHSDLVRKLKVAGKPTYFPQRLGFFLEKYGDEISTCSRLVYPGNPNGNEDAFRFTSWVSMFVRLHKEGWVYDCRTQSWLPSNRGKEAMEHMKRYGITCTAKAYDTAMQLMPSFLKTLKGSTGDFWHFVGWDEHSYGTHSKLQTWVRVPDRKFACDGDLNGKVRETWKQNPEGGEWKTRHVEKQLKDADYIY